MNIRSVLFLLFYTSAQLLVAQTGDSLHCYNLSFEKNTSTGSLPENWMRMGSHAYTLALDSAEKHSGRYSIRIDGRGLGEKDFGCIAFRLPANYTGKVVEVRAWMKLQDASQPIGLMLRVEDKFRTIRFENMTGRGIKGTAGWTQYSVKLDYPPSTHMLYIGAILQGAGVLWADDFEMYIDGKNICGLKQSIRTEFKADLDHTFDKGSGISTIAADPVNCENLAVLCKVWGFLKYYHPAVRRGDYNWDYELFRVLPKILAAPGRESRNEVLRNWVQSLGPAEATAKQTPNDKHIRIHPDTTWLSASLLGAELYGALRQVQNAHRTAYSYYVDAVIEAGNPDFTHENPYPDMKYPDAGFRLLSLFRYWNTIQYFYPYKYQPMEDWNEVLKTSLPAFLQAGNELEYELAALSLICRIHDSHAGIVNPSPAMNSWLGLNYAPVEITFIENKAVVTGFLNTDGREIAGLQTGDVIETIQGRPLQEYLKERLPYTSGSNLAAQLRNLAVNLLRTNDSTIAISRLRGDSREKLILACYPFKKEEAYKRFHPRDTCFRFVSPGIACLFPATLKEVYLSKLMPEVRQSKGLIIDMRCYPTDFIVYSLGKRLVFRPHTFAQFSTPDMQNPGVFRTLSRVRVGSFHARPYRGKLIILVNEYTQSQAEFTSMAFRKAPGALILGSNTTGADGNVSDIVLPGGIHTMISALGVYYPDGKETQRIGLVPDIEVKPTIKGVREHSDELMEKAVELLNRN